MTWRKKQAGALHGTAVTVGPGTQGRIRRDNVGKVRAAMLVAALAGESAAGGNCTVATVVISGSGASCQAAGSPEVKVFRGLKGKLGSAPTGRRASRQVVTRANGSEAPKSDVPMGMGGWGWWEMPRLWILVEGQRGRRRNWVGAADEFPGVADDDRSTKNSPRKHGTTHWSPRRRKTTHSEDILYKPCR